MFRMAVPTAISKFVQWLGQFWIQTERTCPRSLTGVLDVTDDPVIDRGALGIEATIVVPVDVAVSVEIFAHDCAGNVWSAIDCEVSRRGIKQRGKARV